MFKTLNMFLKLKMTRTKEGNKKKTYVRILESWCLTIYVNICTLVLPARYYMNRNLLLKALLVGVTKLKYLNVHSTYFYP
jgi:hypothetical protein